MFADIAKVFIKSGKGGNGHVSFRRELYVPAGGPDGGDGGKGGDIIVEVDKGLNTLEDFRNRQKYIATPGEEGGGKRMHGKNGKDLVIRVPEGTIIRDFETKKIIADMSGENQRMGLLKGGKGGLGNMHFATPAMQAPKFAQPGQDSRELWVQMELRVIADVGLVGFPNVGKSTLLSMASAARPKIANYHFTTLVPNLGVVRIGDGESFVMADIPGIIEGASEGAGLGHDFLRHIDRCRLLLHVVDAAGSEGRDPIDDLNKINDELAQYSMDLEKRPQIVVANKIDLFYDDDHSKLDEIRQWAEDHGFAYAEMSAATNQGVRELMNMTWHALEELPPVLVYEPEFVPEPVDKPVTEESITYRRMNEYYIVEGEWIDRLFASINFDDYESRQYLDRRLRGAGVFDKLEEMGIKDGDPVVIGEMEFEYER